MKNKVLFVSTSFFPKFAGTEIEIYNLATELSKKYNLTLLLPNYLKNYNHNKNYNFRIKYFNDYLLKFYSKIPNIFFSYVFSILNRSLKKEFKDHKKFFFFIHPTATFFSYTFKNIDVLVPQGVDVQTDSDSNYGFSSNIFIRKLMQKTSKNSLCLYMSDSMKNSIMKNLEISENKLIYVPTATNIKLIEKYKTNNLKFRKKYNLLNEEKVLLTTSRYNPKKGLEIIELVIGKLKSKGFKNFKWIILGKNTNVLIKKFNRKTLENIIFIDEIKINHKNPTTPPLELVEFYKNCDVYCNTSRIEGFSLTNLDIMVSKKPIVAFDVPGLNDILNENNSFLSKLDDVEEYANNIVKASKGNQKVVLNSYEDVKKFDWKNVIKMYENLINS